MKVVPEFATVSPAAIDTNAPNPQPAVSPSSPSPSCDHEPLTDDAAADTTKIATAPSRQQRLRRLIIIAAIAVLTVVAVVTTTTIATHSSSESTQVKGTSFGYRTYSEIVDAMLKLEAAHPQFVEVFTAQDKYGLPLRDELQCTTSNGTNEPCKHYVIKITDEASLPDPQRPELFFSGGLHGDERVGPQSAIALAELLVTNAAKSDGGIAWLQRLVKTRTIVIMPTTNAYGYDQNTREENGVDPNRDFPYLRQGSQCFQSIATRAVNEVWRAHLFQLSITWHAGTRCVSYEWGSTNHLLLVNGENAGSEVSPDDQGQYFVAMGLSRYSGKFQEEDAYYPTGIMNDIVYDVAGGMEDWGYAASWENDHTLPQPIGVCEPTTYGGYDTEKSVYNNATHRAFNILVETSDEKEPDEASLGDTWALSEAALSDFLPSSEKIGHVPRNVRLALYYIELVQPYVLWTSSPLTADTKNSTAFVWEVAGAITVDSTQLAISTSADMATTTTTTQLQSGVSRWYHEDMGETSTTQTSNKGLFSEQVLFPKPGVYYVQASATVDQNWGTQPLKPKPNVKPQTHIVNARTDATWFYQANNKTVAGKLVWTSPIVRVVVV